MAIRETVIRIFLKKVLAAENTHEKKNVGVTTKDIVIFTITHSMIMHVT